MTEEKKESKSVWHMIQEQKEKYGTRKNTFAMFPVGCRAKVITFGQDFNFFRGNEKGTVVKNTGTYLGIELKFDEPRHFEGGQVQKSFNFEPDDLIPLPYEDAAQSLPYEEPKLLVRMTDKEIFEAYHREADRRGDR